MEDYSENNSIFNKCQTPLEKLNLNACPKEVQEQFWDFINNVPLIKWMVSKNRPYISELPRDDEGKAIIDVTHPPILEDTDFFCQTGNVWRETGKYSSLRPNANPNSEYGRWLWEERRRGWEGLINPANGMWVTGDFYWMLNYCPMHLVEKLPNGMEIRKTDMPRFWDGQFFISHYFLQARQHKHHAAELASRGRGKTTLGGAMLAKRFIIGETELNQDGVQCLVTASDRTKLVGINQLLTVFVDNIDHCAKTTQFAAHRLKSSFQELSWKMGYKKSGSDVEYGSKNSVMGVLTGVNQDKLNGSRGVLYIIEEAGIFKDLLSMYNMIRPSVEQGTSVFGEILSYGTAGNEESDFTAFQEMIYSPEGYNIESLNNVYDKEGQGMKKSAIFYPAYLNYDNSCMDKDGNSDVTKALLLLLMDRYKVKYGTTDLNTITKRISQYPITPQEAILRSNGSVFPVTELNERLNQIDNTPGFYDDTYVGELIQNKEGKIEFKPTVDIPIRNYPLKDNQVAGALEIYQMPEKTANGEVPFERYILSLDPYDTDGAETMSLGSILVLDLWTDKIVAEYTGRPKYIDDFFDICLKLCRFYNGRLMYEAHPYTQQVRLPNGETKQWGDVQIGDELFAPNGNTVKVVDIPMDGEDDIYKVTFADGRTVEASSNHIWSIYKLGSNTKLRNVTTKEMYDEGVFNKHSQKRFFVPDSGTVQYPHKDVPIDPYALGILIAEGSLTKFRKTKNKKHMKAVVQFSAMQEDAEYYGSRIPYPIKYIGTKGYSWHMYIDDIDLKLKDLGLIHCHSEEKFIPDLYLFNDYNTRLELLKGLMDTDGCAVSNGASVYITTSPKLRDNIMLLCRSLGIKCNENKGTDEHHWQFPHGNYLCKQSYRIAISADIPIFSLPRKLQKQHIYNPDAKGSKAKGFLHRTGISNIKYVGKKKCKCVTVNAEDGLYLIGDYVVTHNCNKKGAFSFFSAHHAVQWLADTPKYLKDKQLIKSTGYGNASKGVVSTVPIKNYGLALIKNWLIKPVPMLSKDENGNDIESTIPNLFYIKSRALVKELMQYNSSGNFDRVSSLIQLMIYREEMMILYQGNLDGSRREVRNSLANDEYFEKNYNKNSDLSDIEALFGGF